MLNVNERVRWKAINAKINLNKDEFFRKNKINRPISLQKYAKTSLSEFAIDKI